MRGVGPSAWVDGKFGDLREWMGLDEGLMRLKTLSGLDARAWMTASSSFL